MALLPVVSAFGGITQPPEKPRGPVLSCLCEGRFAIGDRVKYCDVNFAPFAGYGTGERAPTHDEMPCTVIGMRDGELMGVCDYKEGVNGPYICPFI